MLPLDIRRERNRSQGRLPIGNGHAPGIEIGRDATGEVLGVEVAVVMTPGVANRMPPGAVRRRSVDVRAGRPRGRSCGEAPRRGRGHRPSRPGGEHTGESNPYRDEPMHTGGAEGGDYEIGTEPAPRPADLDWLVG